MPHVAIVSLGAEAPAKNTICQIHDMLLGQSIAQLWSAFDIVGLMDRFTPARSTCWCFQ